MELKDLEILKADPKWKSILEFVSEVQSTSDAIKTERDTLDRKNQFYEALVSAQADLITSLRINNKSLHNVAQDKLTQLMKAQDDGAIQGIPTRGEQMRMMLSSVDNTMTRVNGVLEELTSRLKEFNPK